MTFNTATVAAASTPTFFKTFLSHFLKQKSTDPTQDPTHALSYHEALALVRRFLEVASHHTVDEVQAFTAMHVPIPRWVHDEIEVIPSPFIDLAASVLQQNLGQEEIEAVGGREWWQIRHSPLDVEWIEMKRDYITRQQSRQTPGHDMTKEKVMLYIHGGAYYFGAVDEHRYQIQRHARKLGARACAPRYRLAPQYPFPCCLHDNLSAYLWLIAPISEGGCGVSPKSLILAGDSAGGGAALSLACILRDQGLPLPAGLVLISPWVDLTHSFPSVVKDNSGDYIPAHGFLHKPSLTWPPPTQADISAAERGSGELDRHIEQQGQGEKKGMLERLGLKKHKEMEVGSTYGSARRAAPSKNTSIIINNTLIQIRDQIQLYAPNELLAHRLVSPVMQEDLGGLCPTLVVGGGAEMLRDEMIWIGHAMAGHKYPPTKVKLMVWDGCCHVTPTLSFTRPARYMYRAVANWGVWCIEEAWKEGASQSQAPITMTGHEGPFHNNMIRLRVDTHGRPRPMEPESEMYQLAIPLEEIGVIKEGPVKRWMEGKSKFDAKYKKAKLRVQKERATAYARAKKEGFVEGRLRGERPPPSAVVSRSTKEEMEKAMRSLEEARGKTSAGLASWVETMQKKEHK
ncbi:alpha/beta-hydrolase [Saitoella complicata NRRL Y-17804]|uniref:alpha/beta-hydrolase n=1 Tax=Saitoella complicata (strain BCRC 22490 / CBS 7301 / JCM 7358 / NBRC 10748 / NRRL Y-17804) TaxID=698492 RepID=UPI00086706C2|nr:alpha/beta-hydrolase [Saitoella complicata NRRL Y-17804]ODQ49681.1 alpha/beta-hydrolase [Saitoella complicata NRRL Y-17804]